MPGKFSYSAGLSSVAAYTALFAEWLQKICNPQDATRITSALNVADFKEELQALANIRDSEGAKAQQAHYAAIETVLRETFYGLLASTSIDQPSFKQVWNLLDIITIISDNGDCDPALAVWLVEELLDSQTVEGCRVIFDYLESRRESIITKHFKPKHLVILRTCNELLRRLSRAEDTVFCGRVFIYLFQSFPLGDRSSVNLRGEYHVDNITTYDKTSFSSSKSPELMDIDIKDTQTSDLTTQPSHALNKHEAGQADVPGLAVKEAKGVTFQVRVGGDVSQALDADTLYPIFWSLQEYFSTPTKLFDTSNLEAFKRGLEATISKFKQVQKDSEERGATKRSDDHRRGTKRKRNGASEENTSAFNPKYLTSRDLFELEISDLAFRRHVLVQALILTDFLLSQTPKAKIKTGNLKNKAVLYDFALQEDDTIWAMRMRLEIASYLQYGPDGKFYYRMVDTVLLRDKNWVHWKAESCEPFQRPSVSAENFVEARNGAQKACANKRLRATPLGSLDLRFLSDGENMDGMENFKEPARYAVPSPESLRGPIADDEFDSQTAKSEDDKQLAASARASKLWRMLRICYKSKLRVFDKIDDGNNLEALFENGDLGGDDQGSGDAEPVEQEQQNVSQTSEVPVSPTPDPSAVAPTKS